MRWQPDISKQSVVKYAPLFMLAFLFLGLAATWTVKPNKRMPDLELSVLKYEQISSGQVATVRFVNHGPGSILLYVNSAPLWQCVAETDGGMRTNHSERFTGATAIMPSSSNKVFRVLLPDGAKRWQVMFGYGVENVTVRVAETKIGEKLPRFFYSMMPEVDERAHGFYSRWFTVPETNR